MAPFDSMTWVARCGNHPKTHYGERENWSISGYSHFEIRLVLAGCPLFERGCHDARLSHSNMSVNIVGNLPAASAVGSGHYVEWLILTCFEGERMFACQGILPILLFVFRGVGDVEHKVMVNNRR